MASRKLHCCANLPFLFKEEEDLLHRFSKASKCGFKSVEFPFPEELTVASIAQSIKKNNLTTVMMNSCRLGSQNGWAAIPGKESNFLTSLNKSVELCKALNCSKLHVVAGVVDEFTRDHDQTYEKNIKTAVDICQNEVSESSKHSSASLEDWEEQDSKEIEPDIAFLGITVLIEPISPSALPNYYLNNFDKAVELIMKINSPNLKLQVDLYHLQLMKGNLANNIKNWFPLIGHIQVAQVPNRNEPDTPGEINYKFIFDLLSKLNYDKWIGFEYNPTNPGNVAAGLSFVDEMGLTLEGFPDSSF